MGEAGGLGYSSAPVVSAHVRQRLVTAGPSIRVLPAGLREPLVAAAIWVRLVLAPAGRPEGKGLPLALYW